MLYATVFEVRLDEKGTVSTVDINGPKWSNETVIPITQKFDLFYCGQGERFRNLGEEMNKEELILRIESISIEDAFKQINIDSVSIKFDYYMI